MPKFPWWVWVIIILIVIGLLPGLYHAILGGLVHGAQTVCPSCQTHG